MPDNNVTQQKLFNRYYRLFIIPMIFLLYLVLSYLVNPYSKYWSLLFTRPWEELLTEWAVMMLICGVITEFSLISARWMDKRIPWEKWPLKRFIAQLFCQIVSVFILLRILTFVLTMIFGPPPDVSNNGPEKLDEWQFVFVCVMLSILISAVQTGNYLLQRWKTSMMEAAELKLNAAELKQIAMQAELQSLKLQLDPHFMFNNFSTLSALIEEDKNMALSFLENLSRVYRYMIINLHNDLITLREELKFIQAYAFLIKIRNGENVDIQTDIPEAFQSRGIPPITLQLLIENAIKHNVASTAQPLHIRIYINEAGTLTVSNNIQLIPTNMPSTKLGLQNIRNRYRLLSDQSTTIKEENGLFMVTLPLLDF
ncbi:sensor histidine kinase [Chitinophaga arvensicola]|uniref:Histidine kinase n=1 Tax=Chitinophaga arvensicola TaxID=29529 RepID=A0A1I0RTH6_9BACT|nr:histidine kinase [Chitinophaga arvensicola]SEW44600.1 Histidine kinase [Chitinophaga arvensicola]